MTSIRGLLSLVAWATFGSSTAVTSSGWKPIPPPRGLYIPNTPHSLHTHESPRVYNPHTLAATGDDYRLASSLASQIDSSRIGDSGSTSEIFFNSPSHGYKFSSDLSHTNHELDTHFKKEPLKSYKPVLSSPFEDFKRPTYSFNSFNTFKSRKPIKVGFYEKPEPFGYSDLIKHEEVPVKHQNFLENEIKPYGSGQLSNYDDRQCSIYKVAFRQDLYFQYIQYKVQVPDMKEFTLCMWNKFSNHSNDHPLFSYAVRNQPKAVFIWVSTTDRSNYYNMAINGHGIFRLNYPIRLNKWYHTCSSWNGKTGEWQVWVNAERIGRGFHNLLVGHKIPGGGIAITGQEQRQLGGGFIEGPDAPKGSGGFLGEVTMVQLYRVALTAGKAFNDHRHHHSLKASSTPEPPPPPQQEEMSTTEHPFLENGQIRPKIPVFELAESLRNKNNPDQPIETPLPIGGGTGIGSLDLFSNPFAQPGFYSAIEQPILTPFMMAFPGHTLFKRGNEKTEDTRSKRNGDKSQGNEGVNTDMKVKFVPTPQQVHVDKVKFSNTSEALEPQMEDIMVGVSDSRQKREFVLVDEDKQEPDESWEREGRRLRRPVRQNQYGVRGARPRPRRPPPAMRKQESEQLMPHPQEQQTMLHLQHQQTLPHPQQQQTMAHPKQQPTGPQEDDQMEEGSTSKRQIFHGDFGFGQFIRQSVNAPQPTDTNIPDDDDDGPRDPMEPAEGEVRRIMAVCSGCEADPFRKVAVISWRSAPKKIYSGALFLKARPECRGF